MPTTVSILLDGVEERTRVRQGSVTIHDVLNDDPNTCSLVVDGTPAPTTGEDIRVEVDGHLLFNGAIQQDDLTYEGKPTQLAYPCNAIDDTSRLNKRRPFGTWVNTSATTIAQYLVATFAPGFTSVGVEASLPDVSITFDGATSFMGCLVQLANLIGGYTYVEDFDVHLFLTESTDLPDPIQAGYPFLDDPPIRASFDDSQLRTRVYGKGHAEPLLSDVVSSEDILPIADAVMYNLSGGQVIASTTSDGAVSEILTYTGVRLGGSGSLVGTGATPSSPPSLDLAVGAGLGTGDYAYAYTDVTGAGESLPSPLGTITTGGLIPGATTFNSWAAGLGVGQLAVGTTYEYASAWSTHAVAGNHGQETPVGALVAIVAQADGGGGSKQNVIDLPFTADPTVLYVHVYRRIAAGAYHYIGARANNDPLQQWFDAVSDASVAGNPAPANTLPAGNQVVVTGIAIGAGGTTSRKIYRTIVNGSQLKLHSTLANNTATVLPANDSTADGSLGANAPTTDLSGLTQPTGQVNAGAPVMPTASAAGFFDTGGWALISGGQVIRYTGLGSTLAPATAPLLALVAGAGVDSGVHKYAYTYISAAGESLPSPLGSITTGGGNNQVAVTGVTVGPAGTLFRGFYRSIAGSTNLLRVGTVGDNTTTAIGTDTATDASIAGASSPPIYDTSQLAAGQALIGIPTSGPGSILTTVLYGSQVVAAPSLVGVTGLAVALAKGSPVHLWVQRDDLAAQAAAATRESTGSYTSDGVHEHLITDERRGEASLTQLCDADLIRFANPLVTVTYATRDPKTKSGKPIVVNLTTPPISETLTIQSVTIDQIDVARNTYPRFTVTASSVRFSLEAILRKLAAAV